MLPEKIMQSDLLDILFENRNKTYGAYALRKSYNKILIASIGCTLFVAMGFSTIQFVNHANKSGEKIIEVPLPDIILENATPVKIPATHIQQASQHLKQVNNSIPVITPDYKTKLPPTTEQLDKAVIGNIAMDGKDNPGDIIQAPEEVHGNTGIITTTVKADDGNAPLISADVMPQFPGGEKALIKFIQQNIHQPNDLQQGEIIRVLASLVITKSGEVDKAKIIGSGRKDLDKEVLRVINKMPLWKPGMQNGKSVSVYFNLPVTFQSADE